MLGSILSTYYSPEDYAFGLRFLDGELAKSATEHKEQLIFKIALDALIDKRTKGGLAKAYQIAHRPIITPYLISS
ncbi:MAG: hypothetical protein ACI8T1_003148 [Verrucomicrobiales bacterium]|jgi:hypothetical protein